MISRYNNGAPSGKLRNILFAGGEFNKGFNLIRIVLQDRVAFRGECLRFIPMEAAKSV